MRRISIIVNNALAKRQFLCTPFFDILKNNPQNKITIFVQPNYLSKKFKSGNVKVCSYQNFLWLRKLRFKRSSIVFWAFKLFGIRKSDIIILASWIDEELVKVLRLAQQLNIPTLFVQEGLGNPWENYSSAIYPAKLAVWGNAAKQAYIKRGIDPGRIEITGQPRFDWYYKLQKKDIFPKINGKKTLLYATQPLWKEPKRFRNGEDIVTKTFNIVYRVCNKLELQLVCKLHPSDKPDFYKREGVIILEEAGSGPKNHKKWYCNTGYDPSVDDIKRLGHILLSSDLVVTIFSTVGLEALIVGKPVIFLDIADYAEKEPVSNVLMENAGFAFINSEEGFTDMVIRYINEPDVDIEARNKAISDLAYRQDGRASERVAALIEGKL